VLSGIAAAAACGWGRAVGPGFPLRTGRSGPADRAVGWLLQQQSADGGFRSSTTGFLKPGATLTALILVALCDARAAGTEVPQPATDGAAAFLVAARAPFGALGWGLVPEYPTYATALAVRALARAARPGWRAEAEPMVAWLLAQQLAGDAWGAHPARGGFPMGSPEPRTPPAAGHVDLSMTRHALQALRAFGLDAAHPAWAEGRRFVAACATPDGGFRYAPAEPEGNKGDGPDAGYGTPTADGVLALSAIGGADDAVARGRAFLGERFRADANPGLGDPFRAYGPAMRFYWRSVSAAALAGTDAPAGWREAIRDALRAEQRPDGRWEGDSGLQKEDDPLVATGLGVLAWCAAISGTDDGRGGVGCTPGSTRSG
jgi:hypothetical protein